MNRLYSLEEVQEVRKWHIEFRDNLLRDNRFQEAIIESLTIAMLADLIASMESPQSHCTMPCCDDDDA